MVDTQEVFTHPHTPTHTQSDEDVDFHYYDPFAPEVRLPKTGSDLSPIEGG